ncbi:hypothetical protein, partial [Neglectibacter timonensis]
AVDEVESLTLPAAAEYRLETPHQSPSATASPQGEAFELCLPLTPQQLFRITILKSIRRRNP